MIIRNYLKGLKPFYKKIIYNTITHLRINSVVLIMSSVNHFVVMYVGIIDSIFIIQFDFFLFGSLLFTVIGDFYIYMKYLLKNKV